MLILLKLTNPKLEKCVAIEIAIKNINITLVVVNNSYIQLRTVYIENTVKAA
jgi:hypothetical protein